MRVKEVMTPRMEVIHPDNTLSEAAARMKLHDVGTLPVGDNDKVVGILTDRDIVVRAIADGRDPKTAQVRDIMTPGVVTCFEDDLVSEAALLMEGRQIRRLVVLARDNHPVGILSLGDLAVETGDDELAGQILEEVSEPTPP